MSFFKINQAQGAAQFARPAAHTQASAATSRGKTSRSAPAKAGKAGVSTNEQDFERF
jgi:hypothetical protein